MYASYHNHSQWSDGVAPLSELVAQAEELGVDEVGISDHLVLNPSGEVPGWSMVPQHLPAYVAEVLAARATAAIPVRLGVEVDWFEGHQEAIAALLDGHSFDYVIGSVHNVGGFPVDSEARVWREIAEDERDRVHAAYWKAIRTLAASGLVDIIGHLDLPKKFGFRATGDLAAVIGQTLDAIRDAGTVVELNTSGWNMPCHEAYPSPELVAACVARKIPMILSADAHHPKHLARDFGRGARLLWQAGVRSLVRFDRRRRVMVELPVSDVGGLEGVRSSAGGGFRVP